jgi:ribosomal protein S27AE
MCNIHINFARYNDVWINKEYCPTCDKDTVFLAEYQEWYGANYTCIQCGEEFDSEEGMKERPFRPRWRKDNIKAAIDRIRKYKKAGILTDKRKW